MATRRRRTKTPPTATKGASRGAKAAARSAIRAFRDGTLTDDDGSLVTDENTAAAIAMRRGMEKSGVPTTDSKAARTRRARAMDGVSF